MKFIVLSFLALFTFSHAAKIKISGSWFEKMTVLSQDGTTYKTVYTPISNKNNKNDKNDKFNKGERHEKEKPSQKSNKENGNSDAHIQVSPPVNVQTPILKEEAKNSDFNINVIPVEIQKKQKQLKQEIKNTNEAEVKQIIPAKDDTNIKSIELPKIQIGTIQVEPYQNLKKSKSQQESINLVGSQPDNTPVNSNLKEEAIILVEPKVVNKDEVIKQEQLSSAFANEKKLEQTPIDKQVVPNNIAGSSSIQSSQQVQITQAQPAVAETKKVVSGVETEKQGKIIDEARKKVQQLIQSKMSATASPFSVITESDRKMVSSSIMDKDGNYVSDSTNRVQGKENYVNGTYNNVTGVKNSVENGHYNDIEGHFNKILNGTNNVVSGNGAFIIGSNNKVYSS